MQTVFGNRRISITRELTKTYEEVITSDLNNVIKIIDKRKNNNDPLKGEVVLVVEGSGKEKINYEMLSLKIREKLEKLSVRDAVNEIIVETKLPRTNFFFNLLF